MEVLNMKWQRIPLGPLQTNSYLLYDESKQCIIFDPGSEGARLNKIIKDKQLTPLAILLTHAHFDHIGAVDDVREKWDIPVYIHKREKLWLEDPSLNGSSHFLQGDLISARPADHLLGEEGKLTIGPFTFEVFETPGHSPGSVSFYLASIGVVFSGDALFYGSIGRTDLRGGNHEQLLTSIRTRLLTLPEDTIVLSGHGPETLIEQEMKHNPFLK